MYKVLGIDPGTNYVGVSILTLSVESLEIKEISTHLIDLSMIEPINNHVGLTTKMRTLESIMFEIFITYRPDRVSIEDAYMRFGRPRAYGALIKSTQAIERAFVRFSDLVSFKYYSPSNAKLSVGAKGRAKKDEVLTKIKEIDELNNLINFDNVSEHEVDGVLLAYTDLLYLRKNKVELIY